MLFENPMPLNLALTTYDKAYICHYWKNDRYFSKTHLATPCLKSSALRVGVKTFHNTQCHLVV